MTDPIHDLAAEIVRAQRSGEPLEGLTGIVEADDGGGTVTVDLGGTDPTPGIPRLDSYTSPANGDVVVVLLIGHVPWVIGRRAT